MHQGTDINFFLKKCIIIKKQIMLVRKLYARRKLEWDSLHNDNYFTKSGKAKILKAENSSRMIAVFQLHV